MNTLDQINSNPIFAPIGFAFDQKGDPEKNSQRDKSAGRKYHDYPGLEPGTHDLVPKKSPGPQDFSYAAQDKKGQDESGAHAKGIDKRPADRVFRGKGFLPTENDTVDHDQRDIRTQGFGNGIKISLQDLVGDGHEAGDDNDVGSDADLSRNELFDGRHHERAEN